jgi:hypothetical protein
LDCASGGLRHETRARRHSSTSRKIEGAGKSWGRLAVRLYGVGYDLRLVPRSDLKWVGFGTGRILRIPTLYLRPLRMESMSRACGRIWKCCARQGSFRRIKVLVRTRGSPDAVRIGSGRTTSSFKWIVSRGCIFGSQKSPTEFPC